MLRKGDLSMSAQSKQDQEFLRAMRISTDAPPPHACPNCERLEHEVNRLQAQGWNYMQMWEREQGVSSKLAFDLSDSQKHVVALWCEVDKWKAMSLFSFGMGIAVSALAWIISGGKL